MNSVHKRFLITVLVMISCIPSGAQYGYSNFVATLIAGVSDSCLALTDRQLSGDTSVYIGGVLDTIKSRNSNYPGNARAAQFILEKFQSYGIDAEYQQYDDNGYNVVGTITGTVFPDEQFIICAHYDAMPNGLLAPGADDNATGVSAILEAARLMSPYDFDYTVKFIAFDEEEQGLIGSRAYADTAYKYGEVIRGVINLDMIGWDGNGDFEMSVSSNEASIPLLADLTDIFRIYKPSFSPHLIIIPNSDHSRFWNRGYPALLAIEEYPGDFYPYYHTVNDLFENINLVYFKAMTEGAIASLATMARNYKMTLGHQPVEHSRHCGNMEVNLAIVSPNTIDTGLNSPRLYFNVNDNGYSFLNPYRVSGDTFSFSLPGQQAGSKISYYFAVQDIDGEYVVTLPESGQGIDPPGNVPPPVLFSYYILSDTTATICASDLPLSIPGNQVVNKAINIPYSGHLLDINVSLGITHPWDKDINIYLVSPSGKEVMLSTKNGTSMDHYTGTTFDDEAQAFIYQGWPPFTGTFRPERPLAAFDDTVTTGNWTLKIINAGSYSGSLNDFCLEVTFSKNGNLYVDASRPVSGDGRSWPAAFRTITEAAILEPPAGSLVMIKPGTYAEDVNITSNGQEIVPLKTGIILSQGHKIQFPAGTNLSGIDLAGNPGEYYALVFRSRNYNNGYYQVDLVNDAGDFILTGGQLFTDEVGVTGDSACLCAMVCRPVLYARFTSEPEMERVVVDASGDADARSVLYIGDPGSDGSYDALPANYNIIDGIDLTGSAYGGGIRLQSSSFNVVTNSRIFDAQGTGILIDGNAAHPANFNIIIQNRIFNTPLEGIYIGADGMPSYNNHSHYNHLVGNDVYLSGNGSNARFENAIEINDHNRGTLLERNTIHDISLEYPGHGALEIGSETDHTLVNGNVLYQITGPAGSGCAMIMIHGQVELIDVLNNILYDTVDMEDGMYAFRIDGTGQTASRLSHNTVYQIDRGFLLEDYGNVPEFEISNNIIGANDQYFTNWGNAGRFQLAGNLYVTDPVPGPLMPYFDENGRVVGDVSFINPAVGDFRLTIDAYRAICSGMNLAFPVLLDAGGHARPEEMPDIGAYEIENKIVWTGTTDQNWSNPGNWSAGALPGPLSNVVIEHSSNDPVVDSNGIMVRGILLKDGSSITIPQNIVFELHDTSVDP